MTSTWQTYTGTVVANGAILYITADAAGVWFIDNIIVKEIVPSIVNTSTEVYKDGDINVMKTSNPITSSIALGTYDSLIGDKTFVVWLKIIKDIGYYQNIFNNSKLSILLNRTAGRIQIASESVTWAYSSNGSVPFSNKNWLMLVITRTSTGIANIYINGIISGSANQSSGTPIAGTTAITIFTNGGYLSNYFMDKVRIVDGILTPTEISEIFTAERGKYNV
jgi:hypothetical protein